MKYNFFIPFLLTCSLCLGSNTTALAGDVNLRVAAPSNVMPGGKVSVVVEAVAPPEGFSLAGCAVTVSYDSAAFHLNSVTGVAFSDFASSGISPATVDVDGVTYSTPLSASDSDSGQLMLAAVRLNPLTLNGNETAALFKLEFSVPEDVVTANYSFHLTNSQLTDTDAGYPAEGGAAIALIGKPTAAPDEIASYSPYNATFTDWTIAVFNDSDNDGLTDDKEILYGTDPNNSDTDGDGLLDGAEVNTHSTNPLLADTDGDGTLDGHEILAGTDPNDPADKAGIIVEGGEIQVTTQWQQIVFSEKFAKPVVVANPLFETVKNSATIRLRNITATGFDIRMEETIPGTVPNATESVSYLATETGYFTLESGAAVVAKTIAASQRNTEFKAESYPSPMNSKPVVIASVSSDNEETPTFVRIHNVTADSFQFLLQEPQSEDQMHGEEQISYIAWEASRGIEGQMYFEAASTSLVVTDSPYTINYARPATPEHYFLAGIQTTYDLDPANLRSTGETVSGATVLISEDVTGDPETVHGKESVGYLVVGLLTAPDRDNDGISDADEVTAGTNQDNPDSDDDGLLDGAEVVTYHTNPLLFDTDDDGVGDGAEVAAGTDPLTPNKVVLTIDFNDIEIDQRWRTIIFNKTFINPVVVAKPMSSNDTDFAVIRIRNVTPSSFDIKIQEPAQGANGIHVKEKVTYVAMEAGTYTLNKSTKVIAGHVSAGQVPPPVLVKKPGPVPFTNVSFPEKMLSAKPVVMTAITSVNEETAVTTRIANVSAAGFSLLLQEPEVEIQQHASETISYIAWDVSTGINGNINYEAAAAKRPITNALSPVTFIKPYVVIPSVLADLQTTADTDTAALRYKSKTSVGFTAYVSEDKSKDTETTHGQEGVGYIALSRIPPTVTFASAVQSVGEDDGTVSITAQLSDVSDYDVTVSFLLSGTAKGNGVDYTISSAQITIPAGQTAGSVNFTPIDDKLNENDETAILTMDKLVNATKGACTTHTVTIISPPVGSVIISRGYPLYSPTQIVLSWGPVANATTYRVQWFDAAGRKGVLVVPTNKIAITANTSINNWVIITPGNAGGWGTPTKLLGPFRKVVAW